MSSELGVYVHIPFCAHRCDYCDFATWTDRNHLVDVYVDACVTDVEQRRTESRPPATSVFFGGGTPSLLAAGQLMRILGAIERQAIRPVARPVGVLPARVDLVGIRGIKSLLAVAQDRLHGFRMTLL